MTRKIKDVDIKDYLIQLAGGKSWADSGMPYAMGEPMKKRKKVIYFLKYSREGKFFSECIEVLKSKKIIDEANWKPKAKYHFETFCKQINGLDMAKYGFNHGGNFS